MVAAAGAGPEPIPYNSLTAEKLADAIAYCLTPHAAIVAQSIADKINRETGVTAAVDSFHAHLPRQQMACDLLQGETAVWKIKRRVRAIKLSTAAVLALKSQNYLQDGHLTR
jgi:hypothetical protein